MKIIAVPDYNYPQPSYTPLVLDHPMALMNYLYWQGINPCFYEFAVNEIKRFNNFFTLNLINFLRQSSMQIISPTASLGYYDDQYNWTSLVCTTVVGSQPEPEYPEFFNY